MWARTLLSTFFAVLCLTGMPSLAADHLPVEARLVHTLDAGRVNVGDSILAKVLTPWQSEECVLREGAILKGRVVSLTGRSKTSKTEELALLFESAECDGRALKPLPLTVAAVMASDPRRDPELYESQPLAEAVGLSLNGGVRNLTSAVATVFSEPYHYNGPKTIMPGDVVGMKGVRLNVGGGPEGSSVFTIAGHKLQLDQGSLLVLVPNRSATAENVTAAAASTAPPQPASDVKETLATEPPEESDGCLPPECTSVLSAFETQEKQTASEAFPVKDLGYSWRPKEILGFEYDAAISYLGREQLLFTFNPHELVPRTRADAGYPNLRLIRAVLIDTNSRKVLKTVDWKVLDERQYLWPIGNERILVHAGHELRIYAADLKLEQRISLEGPLAFVRMAPSFQYFAIGTIRERHSESIHRELAQSEAREPEEDVDVKIVDANLKVLAQAARSSRAEPPVLSDYGELRTQHAGTNRWRIIENSWDRQTHVVTSVNSTCRPHLTTFPPHLLFMVGCDHLNDGKWYRVYRSDGKAVLKGWSPSAELEQRVTGTAGGSFSIAIASASRSLMPGAPFDSGDLQKEHINVYLGESGARTLSVTVHSPVPSVQTFALSPDGHELAVMQTDEILLYKTDRH